MLDDVVVAAEARLCVRFRTLRFQDTLESIQMLPKPRNSPLVRHLFLLPAINSPIFIYYASDFKLLSFNSIYGILLNARLIR